MDYVNLGNTGLKVSRICLGMMSYGTSEWRDWVLDEDDSRPFIQRALELGLNFFDTADMYSLGVSEEVTGRALKDFARRDEVVIATKVYHPMSDKPNRGGLSRKHILDACDDSLKRLGTDYIDLYQIHRFDPETPIEETVSALDELVRSGRVRYLGASSMFAYQFAQMLYTADLGGLHRFVSMQNHYNLIYREEEREMLPLCESEGVGVIPWSPLARGYLTRRPSEREGTTRGRSDGMAKDWYDQPSDDAVAEAVVSLAEKRGDAPARVALAWLLHQPAVTAPIVGATKMKHLEDAVKATELSLSAEELAELEHPYQPHPVKGHQ
jgi:aryl-alcohol dehydrogenase-like predicted oxidoreductase